MQPNDANHPARLLIFVGVGIILLGLTIFGIVLAKSRANMYGQKNESTTARQGNEGESSPTPPTVNQPQQTNTNTGQSVAGTQTTSIPSVSVPAAGPQDTVLTAIALGVLAFAGVKFTQSQRIR